MADGLPPGSGVLANDITGVIESVVPRGELEPMVRCAPERGIDLVVGGVLMPGLTDAHCHPLDSAVLALFGIPEGDVGTPDEVFDHIATLGAARDSALPIVLMGVQDHVLEQLIPSLINPCALLHYPSIPQ